MKRSRWTSFLFFILLIGVIAFLTLFFVLRKPTGPQYSIQDLGMVETGSRIRINNLGHVAYSRSMPSGHSVNLWPPGQGSPEILEGSPVIIAVTGSAYIHDLNVRDLIVGCRIKLSKEDPTKGYPQAFVWSATDGVIDLSLENEIRSWAFQVRDDGRILGASEIEEGTKTYLVWDETGRLLERYDENILLSSPTKRKEWISDPPMEAVSYIKEKTENGWMGRIMAHTESHAVGWLKPNDSTLDRIRVSIRNSNNLLGEVLRDLLSRVGFSLAPVDKQFAYVWIGEHIFDLNDCIPEGSGWEKIQHAADLNDHGQIVGFGMRGGRQRLFLLTPIETANEPSDLP